MVHIGRWAPRVTGLRTPGAAPVECDNAKVTTKDSCENAAANAVACHLAAVLATAMTVKRWDDGSAAGMHDFYIEGVGHKIALEVTTIADGRRAGRDVRWELEAASGWVAVEGLEGCWVVYHEGDAEASDVVRAVREEIPRLAALGITRVDARSWQAQVFTPDVRRPSEFEQVRALGRVGITHGNCVTDASQALLNERNGQVQILRGFGFHRSVDRNFPVTVIRGQLRDSELHGSDVRSSLQSKMRRPSTCGCGLNPP